MTWRPLSARDRQDDRFDALHEGVPDWLQEPLLDWMRPRLVHVAPMGEAVYEGDFMRRMDLRVRFRPGLDWSTYQRAANGILARFKDDSLEALDVLDYVLQNLTSTYAIDADCHAEADDLKRILDEGGSAWDVTPYDDGGNYRLTRRAVGPLAEAIVQVGSRDERAGDHLRIAWGHLHGVHPNPSGAYMEAVCAVESVAKPVVTPTDSGATLGKMIHALKDKPSKWTFELGDVERVIITAQTLWEPQVRHGTDDPDAPLRATQEEADAAVHLALTLVRWFTTGAIRRVE